MFYRVGVIILTSIFLLQGCNKKKEPIIGERENILLSDPDLKPDPALAEKQIVLGMQTVNQNWHQPGGTSAHSLHVALPQNKLSEVWRVRVGSESAGIRRLTSPPIIHAGMIYTLNSDGYVVTNRATDGKELWKINIRPKGESDGGLGGGVAYHKGNLYVSTAYAEIIAIDTAKKEIVWRKDLQTPSRAAPTIYQNRLFILTVNNILICADIETGKEIWTHRGMLETAGLLGGTNVAVTDSIAVAPYTSGEVYGLHVDTGEAFWTESLSSFGRVDSIASLPHIHARPVIQDGVAYLVSHSGRTAAIDVKTGDIIWEQNFGGAETPAIAGNTIFMITSDQNLLALEKETGRIRWVKELQRFKDPEKAKDFIVWKGPVLAGNKLILNSSHGHMLLVNAYTGQLIQDIEHYQESSIEPIVVNKTVYVLTNKGYIIAYR